MLCIWTQIFEAQWNFNFKKSKFVQVLIPIYEQVSLYYEKDGAIDCDFS